MPEPRPGRPLQFLVALVMLSALVYWRIRVHRRPSVRRRSLGLKVLVATGEILAIGRL